MGNDQTMPSRDGICISAQYDARWSIADNPRTYDEMVAKIFGQALIGLNNESLAIVTHRLAGVHGTSNNISCFNRNANTF